MGDSILTSLSLPPSGRLPSNQSAGGQKYSTDPSCDTQDRSPFVAPVFGTILNEDVPVMFSKNKGTAGFVDVTEANSKFTAKKFEGGALKSPRGLKRRQPDMSDSNEDGEVLISEQKGINKSVKDAGHRFRQGKGDRRSYESEEDIAITQRKEECTHVSDKETSITQPGVKSLLLQENPSLHSIVLSCLHNQPKVVLDRLSGAPGRGQHSYTNQDEKRKSSGKTSTHNSTSSQHPKPGVDFSSSDNKE